MVECYYEKKIIVYLDYFQLFRRFHQAHQNVFIPDP